MRAAVWFLFGVLLAAVPMLAFAGTETIPATYENVTRVAKWATSYSTPEEACSATFSGSTPDPYSWSDAAVICRKSPSSWVQRDKYCPIVGGLSAQPIAGVTSVTVCAYAVKEYKCPTDAENPWTLEGTTCTRTTCDPAGVGQVPGECGCAERLILTGGKCETDCSGQRGKTRGTSGSYATLNVANPRTYNGNNDFCVDNCSATAGGGVQCHWANDAATGDMLTIGAYCAGQGPFTFTGRNCASYGGGISDVESVESDPESKWWETGQDASKCSASGGQWGQVNGQDVCVGGGVGGAGSGSGDGSVVQGGAETKPGGSSETTNPDGSTTTEKKTTSTSCDGGVCKETTIIERGGKNADGTDKPKTTEQVVKETTQKAFCAENPKGAGCAGSEGDKSAWSSGDCGAEPMCTGDAVQCATARAAWKTACAMRAGDGSTLGEKIAAGNDPAAASMPWAAENVQSVSVAGMLNTTEQFGASCPPDLSFTVGGHVVSVPLSSSCQWLGWIGNIMFAGCLLAGVAIALGRPL